MNEEVIRRIKTVPEDPGVYIFKKEGKTIYIGKAKNLKKRLLSYLKGQGKASYIMEEADWLDFIILRNEREALLLEAELIKKEQPKYNVRLKETEYYPYIRISCDEIPFVEIVRNKVGCGRYYGPYTSISFVRDLLDILQKLYGFRTCKKNLKKVKRPCFEYHLKRCVAPCIGNIEKHKESIEKLEKFLKGETENVLEEIKKKMEHHSLMLDFESAARYRDILLKFEDILSSQGVVLKEPRNLDVITHDDWLFVVLRVRNGFLLGKLVFEMSEGTLDDFVRDFYIIKEKEFPKVIITDDISDEDYSFFGVEYFGKPRDEIEKDLLQRAKENLLKERATRGVRKESLKQLKEILGLHSFPERIDGIDIAHIQGKYTVGSVVVFQNGIPDKREYRHYKLNLENPDDYKAVYIIVKRRYEKHQLPDLLFVDGGKGQVMAALKALKVLKKNCPVVGLAKSEEKIVTEKFELKLSPSHPALKALVSVRDEAHRFANLFHKKIREKESLASLLDNIPGIGKKRKKELMKKFRTIDKIRKASIKELAEVVKSKKIAEEILKRV